MLQLGAVGGLSLAAPALARETKKVGAEEFCFAPEYFMRGHAILARVLLIYEEAERRSDIDPAAMTVFCQFCREPHANDLAHAIRGDHLAAQGQHVRSIVLTAVSRRRFVIAHSGAHSRYLVRHHARPDARAINHDSEIARPARNRPRDKMRVVRIVNRLSRMRPEVLIVVTEIRKQALDLFLHFEAAMVGPQRDSLFLR